MIPRLDIKDRGADFSPCGKYRYYLWRFIGGYRADGKVLFVMLNPSTADAEKDDPTIRRCLGYARAWGFSELGICNLFALRSTDPAALYSSLNPIGEDNDNWIRHQVSTANVVVSAWGTHGALHKRGFVVRRMLGDKAHVLKLTKDGHPSHPLYLKANLKPVAWR